MKIYSLMLVKNEDDIIESTLRAAAQWSDKVIVLDNGSTDKTWEITKSIAEELPQVIAFEQDPQTFKIGLRSILFDHYKSEMSEDDWWCIRLDADEFFMDNPRDFLKDIPIKYKQVYKASYDYCLTTEDLIEHEFVGDFLYDRTKIRYYQPKTWSEVRFVRHSKKLTWNIDSYKPQPCGLTYPQQIRVQHYQFRSPQQMQKRFVIRHQARKEGCDTFKHEKGKNWEDYLKMRKELFYDNNKTELKSLGNRNKFNKKHKYIYKSILTLLGYY